MPRLPSPVLRPIVVALLAGLVVASFSAASEQNRATAADSGRKSISLDGDWAFALDPGNVGEKETWSSPDKPFADKIKVPGCWQAQGVGKPHGCLRHHYEGPAWYKRSVLVPADWKGKTLWLVVGGAARRTNVYVNGRLLGSHDGFSTPFRFDISDAVNAGAENTVALRVDNSGAGPVGCFNYMGNWGGIYRPVKIEATDSTWIDDVFVIPDVDRSQARLRITLSNKKTPPSRLKLAVRVFPAIAKGKKQAADSVAVVEKDVDLGASRDHETEISIPISDMRLWFPETPNLYVAEVTLSGNGVRDVQRVRFGMRKIDWTGGRLKINGRPYFLRGYGDDNVEMLTGLPPASRDFFAKRFALAKSLSFNNVRFHSNVPFEECFDAADEAGMLIQAELPAVYCHLFLPNKDILRKELVRVLKAYRNHPSFFSLAMGNEFFMPEIDRWPAPAPRDFYATVREFYDLAKKLDPTRPIFSNDGDPNLLPTDIRSGAWPANNRPFLCHEYGGYHGSLPDVSSINRFTGLFAPCKGVVSQAKWVEQHLSPDDYATVLRNSQRLFELDRKNLLEAARKNPQIDGYNYWLMTDFPGGIEGDAWYYGVVDQFWRPKQATPESMRKINAATVLLIDAEFGDRSIWTDRERSFKILASHFGAEPIRKGDLSWRLTSAGRTLLVGSQSGVDIDVGEIKQIATAKLGPLDLTKGERLELAVELNERHGTHANSWTIWAFPRPTSKNIKGTVAYQQSLAGPLASCDFVKPFKPAEKPDLLVATELDNDARRFLNAGGTLLFFPKKRSLPGQCDFPLFCTQAGVGPGTVIRSGRLMDRFPHRGFCEGQFLALMQTGTAVNANNLPSGLSPEAWGVIPTRGEAIALSKVAMLFSGRLGKGKILVCTFDVPGNLNDKHPEAFALLQALLEHAASEQFKPNVELSPWDKATAAPQTEDKKR
jgi:beta-galactosidase